MKKQFIITLALLYLLLLSPVELFAFSQYKKEWSDDEVTLTANCGITKPGVNSGRSCNYPAMEAFAKCDKDSTYNIENIPENNDGWKTPTVTITLKDFYQCPKAQRDLFFAEEYNEQENTKLPLALIQNLLKIGIKTLGPLNLKAFLPYLEKGDDKAIQFKRLRSIELYKLQKQRTNKEARHAAINIRKENLVIKSDHGWSLYDSVIKGLQWTNKIRGYENMLDLYGTSSEFEKDLKSLMLLHEACGIMGCADQNYQTSLLIWFANRILKSAKNISKVKESIQILSNSFFNRFSQGEKLKESGRRVCSNRSDIPLYSLTYKLKEEGGYDGAGGGDFAQLAFKMLLIEYNLPKILDHSGKTKEILQTLFKLKVLSRDYVYEDLTNLFERKKLDTNKKYTLRKQISLFGYGKIQYLEIPSNWFNHIFLGNNHQLAFQHFFKFLEL